MSTTTYNLGKKLKTKSAMSKSEISDFEFFLEKKYTMFKDDSKHDLNFRINGVKATRGSSGYQLAGYKTLEQFYRGDQWEKDLPKGHSQKTDNYCATIIDNMSSLVFDDDPEINCPTDDPADDLLELKAEMKEKLIWRTWKDNFFGIEFDDWSKQTSLYGDGFLHGPWMEKNDNGVWEIKFCHIENPGSISLIFKDGSYREIIGYILHKRIYQSVAEDLFGEQARGKGIKLSASRLDRTSQGILTNSSEIPMVEIDELWLKNVHAVFHEGKILDFNVHNWGFVPIEYVKNIYIPNHPYGKSDIEDVLDPQQMYNETNNNLADFLKWISSVNLWGKNLEGMEALVAGMSKIYSLPEDGELHAFEKTGDPYITNTYSQQRRGALIELSGLSESMLSSSQVSNASGRALALAFQGTIRKLNPRIKRFRKSLESLNKNILKLYEIYYPETKIIIDGDYRNEVFLPITLLRNIVDTINKFNSGLISHDTAMREVGVQQPKQEMKLLKKGLSDPILGPQIARNPGALPRLSEDMNQPGDTPMPAQGGGAVASPGGAVAAASQQAGQTSVTE